MIAKLTGRVDSVGRDFAVVDVGGVGYLVFCSGRTLSRLAAGMAASLLIETHVREDRIHLYGFVDAVEREWFRLLTTVQGVGARLGLSILTALGADDLFSAIAAGDRALLTRAGGVGPKLATRIASELKDKVGRLAATDGALADPASLGRAAAFGLAPGLAGKVAEAVSALVNIGFGPAQALQAVSRAAATLGAEARVEALIRDGLVGLAPREHPRA